MVLGGGLRGSLRCSSTDTDGDSGGQRGRRGRLTPS